MYIQQGEKIKLKNILLNIVFTNLLRDESLASEKLSSVLFGRGKLKITIKHHLGCCRATRALVPQNLRPRAGDSMQLD